MTADRERRLLARARALADTGDLAEDVTEVLGGGRAARLDVDALRSLAQCALTLGAARLTVYRATGPAPRDDAAFLAAVDDAVAGLTARAADTARATAEATDALDDAQASLARARRQLAAAQAMPVHQPCDGCHAARAAAIAAARAAIAEAAARAGYAREAIDQLRGLAGQLQTALAWIREVPGDLGETYEGVYELLRRGHAMPKDGDWITGQEPAVRVIEPPRRSVYQPARHAGGETAARCRNTRTGNSR